jgi:hypothetical protein
VCVVVRSVYGGGGSGVGSCGGVWRRAQEGGWRAARWACSKAEAAEVMMGNTRMPACGERGGVVQTPCCPSIQAHSHGTVPSMDRKDTELSILSSSTQPLLQPAPPRPTSPSFNTHESGDTAAHWRGGAAGGEEGGHRRGAPQAAPGCPRQRVRCRPPPPFPFPTSPCPRTHCSVSALGVNSH